MSFMGDPAAGLRAALLRFRVMAYAVGVGLVVLVLVGMPLEYAAGRPEVVDVVGPLHGFLYIVYLIAGADLSRRAGWGVSSLILVVLAGLVPFLTFVMERRITRRAEQDLEPART